MGLWQWSTTPANNASAATNIDWAEGQPPSTVNDSARQMMADVATWYQAAEWLNYGDTPTFVSTTSFSVPGNQTARYTIGRRVRTSNTGGTIYGTIIGSTFTSVTTVTLTPDTGALDSGLSEVDVGILNPAFPSLPTYTNVMQKGRLSLSTNGISNGEISLQNQGGGAFFMRGRQSSGGMEWVNNAYSSVVAAMDDAGNFTATNLSASSDDLLKKDWGMLPVDFLEKLSAIKHGTFTRIADESRNVGVSAQSLQAVLPEAVFTGSDGYLSVAYGNAALVGVIALTREVLRLRALLEPVK